MEKNVLFHDLRGLQVKLSDMDKMEITLSNGRTFEGYKSYARIDKNYGLNGYKLYQIRHTDDDWEEPGTLEKRVIVNHMCDFLTKSYITIPKDGYREIVDWGYF